MIFCIGEGKYESKGIGYQKNLMMFNKPVSEEEYNKQISYIRAKNFKLPIAKWVELKDLSKDEQTETAKQIGGLLKTLSYKDAWAEMWASLSSEDKNFFKTLTNYNQEIFTSITGIKIEEETSAEKEAIELLRKNGYKIIKS